VRVTVDLPRKLVQQADAAVTQGAARSRNQLIARAVGTYLGQLKETMIDAQLARMASDRQYQTLALEVSREFERSDREALEAEEGGQ